MPAQSIASPTSEAVASWRPAPRISLTSLRTWLDQTIVTDRFPASDHAVYQLLDSHGYRPTSDIAWELASNPTYSVALVRALHTQSGTAVKVPILTGPFYCEIAGHTVGPDGACGHGCR